MLPSPSFMRDRPEHDTDPLSDVLAVLQVRSGASLRMTAGGPWALRFPAYSYLKFITQLSGTLYVHVDGDAAPYRLEPGDCLLMRSGRPYVAGTDRTLPAADGIAHFTALPCVNGAVSWGEPGGLEVIAGRFEFDARQRDLLEQIVPPELLVRAASRAAPALHTLLALYRDEVDTSAPGQRALTDALARIALVQALRSQDPAPEGWLAALADPKIGAALSLLHGAPARRWTVADLAGQVAMSRSALALRFRQLVGSTPLHYLQQWRMRLARQALLEEDLPVATLAYRLGYASESAFSAAFRRSTGCAPGQFRSMRPESR